MDRLMSVMNVKSAGVRVNLIDCGDLSILEQLQLEEALLRADDQNYCLINHGSSPAIVMGISGKPERLINRKTYSNFGGSNSIPLIRRYSGGGTVVVDEGTLFISFIFNKSAFTEVSYPCQIMKWTEQFYEPIFPKGFSLRENDYVLGERKFGGNAQSITKNRWVHHSTLLWNYDQTKMNLLTLPEKRPKYREERGHDEFLTCLSEHYDSMERVGELIVDRLKGQFELNELSLINNKDFLKLILEREHRKGTQLV